MHPQICAPRRLQMLPLTMDAAPLPLVLDVDGHFGTVSKIALQAYLRHEGHYRGPVHGDHVPSDAPLGNPETTTALQKLAGHANENGVFGEWPHSSIHASAWSCNLTNCCVTA
eukprot:2756337-Prymnesium_polylepis.2